MSRQGSLRLATIFQGVLFLVFSVVLLTFFSLLGTSWYFISRITNPDCLDQTPRMDLPVPEEHWLSTADGHQIRIWYYPSRNRAAIIVFGGVGGSLNITNFPTKAVVDGGYGVLLVDTRGCAKPDARVTLGADELYDGQAALEFLLTASEVDSDRIGVWGFSMGGSTAIRMAAKNREVQAIIRDGGYSNLQEIFAPTPDTPTISYILKTFNLVFFQIQTGIDPSQINLTDDLANMNSRPILFIYGESEAKNGEVQFLHAKEPKILWIVPGSRHGMNYHLASERYEMELIAFFNQHLLAGLASEEE